jgi:two-component system OmpR family sensor kinase
MMKKMHPSQWSLRNRLILAIMLVAALGIGASDFAANTELKSFLVNQVDTQLKGVAMGSIDRLARAGIDPNADDSGSSSSTNSPIRVVRPLRGVPTATAVTLLDAQGDVLGQLGGDINQTVSPTTFAGMSIDRVNATNGKPFTIQESGHNSEMRAIALALPTNLGSFIVSVSLDSVDRTLNELWWLFFFISLIVLLLIGLASRYVINVSLRPLLDVEVTAAAIADGDLSARLPEAKGTTEVGRLSRSLNTMLERIEDSFAVKAASESKLRRFVADASHELRTPLTAIRGFAELHRQGAVSGEEKTKELIGRIEKESIRMGSLVEDLLFLARSDEARPLVKEPVDVKHLLEESIASATAAGPNHPITLSCDTELFVLGDNKRIHQAVANLLANARTHTPAGTPISVFAHAGENETTISVSDTGPGLSEEDQSRIFERFFRADPSRVRSAGEGSGLGLSIVDAIMKAHGGSVSVTSAPGKGATFVLRFPIASD